MSSGGGGGGGSSTPSYSVTTDKTENGTITVSPKSASKGDTVTITVKPDKGYELDTLKVLDKDGDKVYFQTPDLFAWTAVIVAVSMLFEKLFLALVDALAGKAGL